MMPAPDTDIDVASITFADASVQTTAFTGIGNKIVNGDYEVNLDQAGALNVPRFGVIRNLGSTYDVNIVGAGPNGFVQLQWTTLAGVVEDDPNGTDELKHWLYIEEPGVYIETNLNGTGDAYEWYFGRDGTTQFPTLTVPISDNANPSGTGQTLKFSDSSQQAIIYGPSSTADNISAERVIIQGAPGYTGTAGEGGDVYVWAGPGGSTNGQGGDIKIRAGEGIGSGDGGYLNFQAGDSNTGNGGYVNIESGQSNTYGSGGDITVWAHNGGEITLRTHNSITSQNWRFGLDGSTTPPENTLKGYCFTATNAVTNYVPQAASFMYTDSPILRLILEIGGPWYIKGPGLIGWKPITAVQDNGGVALIIRIGSGSGPLPDGSEFPSGGGNVYTISQYLEFDVKVADKTWTFDKDGRTTFPNGTVPEHSYGAAGDKEGMVVFSDPYIYYCKQDYVDNVTDIWVRVAWTGTNW